jgi:hypothetical protein
MKRVLVVLAMTICLFAVSAEAAAPRLAYRVTKYETAKGNNGVFQVKVTISVTNDSNDERIVTKLYDVKFTVAAQIKSLTSGKVYNLQANPFYSSLSGGNNLDLWPGDSKTFVFNVQYNSFKGNGKWKWEGEEKTGKPPLTNFKTSNISMKYETRKP